MEQTLSIIKPDPAAVSFLLCLGWGAGTPLLSKKSRKKSSKGEPGGNCGATGLFVETSLEIITDTLTTDGISSSANSEKSGIVLAYKFAWRGIRAKNKKNNIIFLK